MKKLVSVLLSMLMIFSFACIGVSVTAEGNTYTVGATAEGANYTTLADAVASVSEGDTIQFVEDITATNVSLNKSITIDTNGYTWTGGTSSKVNCGTVSSGVTVTIVNSKRTEQVTSDITDFDIVCNSVKNSGVFVLNNNANLIMKNIAANSTNAYTNNQPCIVYFSSATTSTLTTDNCYFTSVNWGAVGGNNSAMQISATNSIFGGAKCSIFYVGNASSTVDSIMSFDNCTFLSPISACNATNATAVDNATSTFEKVTYNFKDCKATSLFAPSATAVFDGNCSFATVKSGVVVKAAEGVSLYSDEEHTTNITSGEALAADSAVYSYLAPTSYQISIDGAIAGEVSVGDSYTLPAGTVDGFICYTDGTNYYAENSTITPEKNISLTSVSIGKLEMLEGASMRLGTINGIRFYTKVDTAKIKEVKDKGAIITMGTLIAPENLLNGSDLNLSVPEANRVDISYTVGIEENTWYNQNGDDCIVGSLVNIKQTTETVKGNELRKFVGRGYVTVTISGITKTIYADYFGGSVSNNTRTISYLANMIRENDDTLYEQYQATIDYYANLYSQTDEF
ncbi:MAG: hypothetical protein ACI39F_06340 [Acutalibacteraceae bacterium]